MSDVSITDLIAEAREVAGCRGCSLHGPSVLHRLADALESVNREMLARELHHFEAEELLAAAELNVRRAEDQANNLAGDVAALESVTASTEPENEALWDFAGDLLQAWNIEDTNEPSLTEQFRDMFVARFGVTAPTEPDREALAWVDRHDDVWFFPGGGDIGYSFETQPFNRAHIEKKWGPLEPLSRTSQPVQVEVTDDEHVPLQAAYDDIKAEYAEYRKSVRAKLDIDTVRTVDELNALPVGAVVISEAGTIACRFDESKFVCFGDERPGEPWELLTLPARVLYRPAALGGGE